MVRLVFRPHTQLRRTICTSVSRRSSNRFSPVFDLVTYSSPSFGSHHVYSASHRSKERAGDAAIVRLRIYHFHYASRFSTEVLANIIVSLVRVSRRVIEVHFVNMPNTLMALASLSHSGMHPTSSRTPLSTQVHQLPRRGTCFDFHSPE